MSFVNPGLLFGALLFAVPLIIHLLNRQRYRRRPWAAMEFLLAAYRKQRRRIRFENLLLLLLRCLIPVLLALGIARPVLRDALQAPLLGSSAHHVLVLDASYSMSLRPEGSESPFARLKSMATELLEGLEGRSGQRVTLVLAGVRVAVPVQEDLNIANAKARIAALTQPQDSATDLTAALAQVADLLDEGREPDSIVYLLSDLQARAFGEAQATPPPPEVTTPAEPATFQDTARDLCERIQKRSRLVVLDTGGLARDVGDARADNLQVVDLRLATPVAVARTTVPLVATIRNRSERPQTVQATLELDGGQPIRASAEFEAFAEGQIPLPVTFRDTGLRWLRLTIEGDGLGPDNERFLVVPVRERIKVLLVEGSSEREAELRDSEYLRALLDPTRGEGPPELTTFAPRTIEAIDLLSGREDPRLYDLVVLAGVERLNDATAVALKEAVARGVGLWILLAERCDAASYNLHLHHGQDPLLPVLLTSAMGFTPGGSQWYESRLAAVDHPVFAGFTEDVYRQTFQLTPIYRFVASAPEMASNALILSQVRDPELSPLLVAKTYGDGKLLLLTTTLTNRHDRWNRLDLPMLALPFVHEAARWLTQPAIDPYNCEVGAELTAPVPGRPTNVTVVLPERAGGGKVPVAEDSRVLPGGQHLLPPFRQTEFAGLYTVDTQLGQGGDARSHQVLFAVNPDPREGDLTYASHEQVRKQLGVNTVLRQVPATRSNPATAGSSDLGLTLLGLALLLIVGEGVIARLVAHRRSP